MRGLIHIYTGDGKGKTTAAVGLALRFAGHGGRVLFSQFLKKDDSGELSVLCGLPQITYIPCGRSFGFTTRMTEQTRREAALHYTAYFEKIAHNIRQGDYGLLIFDEILVADHYHLIPHEKLLSFLSDKPHHLEVVMTGRNPAGDLLDLADYISEIKKIRHPFDQGIPARKGIEQ